jgi:hypothetical protein
MSKLKRSFVLILLSAMSLPAMAGEAVVKRVPAGAIAFHFVLDLTVVPSPPELIGYVAFIEGVDGLPFNGIPSKDTAHFTIRLTGATPPPVPLPVEPDPELAVGIITPGAQFTVFYNPNPDGRDWSNPLTFEEGVPIAVFEESALLNTVGSNANLNLFSSRLIDSTPIDFNGQKIDFRKLVPNGVTITNFGNGGFRFRPYNNTVGNSAAATAIAIGGKLRGTSDD